MRAFERLVLSKSRYIRGLQCQKSLYLHTYHPELRDDPSDAQQAVFSMGTDVGKLGQSLFPGGVEIPYDGLTLTEQLAETASAIKEGASTLYEAAAFADGILIKADIIRRGDRGWEIYEVKSSTSMKDLYIHDVGLQYHVLKNAGFPVEKAYVVFINSRYVRQGDLDIQQLFHIQDVTQDVLSLADEIVKTIRQLKCMLEGPCPEIDVGRHCHDPYRCDFIGQCWAGIPEDSILHLRGEGAYRLYAQGIRSMRDVPWNTLSESQQIQVLGTLENRDTLKPDNIRSFLNTLHYPLCFLDFETIQPAIPPFDGIRPYQQIPFQFSLHRQNREMEEMVHVDYLADPCDDYREEFVRRLLPLLPGKACIVAYNMSFEKTCLANLASWLPHHRAEIEQIMDGFRDLMVPFRRRDLYLHTMKGSYSLKDVLPALIPEITYADLEIREGAAARAAFRKLSETQDANERSRLRRALLDYCKQDTLAMTLILEKLRSMIS